MRDTTEMAREVYGAHTEWNDSQLERLESLFALVRADEREACAKVVWDMKNQSWAYDHDTIAAAIRARGDT